MEKPFRKTGKVMNVPLLKRFCEGGVFGWWETVAERVIQFSQPRPQVLPYHAESGIGIFEDVRTRGPQNISTKNLTISLF